MVKFSSLTSYSRLEHARAVAFAIVGAGTPYSGPFRGSKAAAQIALGASGTTGAQVAHTMVLARSLRRGGCSGQRSGEISLPGAQFGLHAVDTNLKQHFISFIII